MFVRCGQPLELLAFWLMPPQSTPNERAASVGFNIAGRSIVTSVQLADRLISSRPMKAQPFANESLKTQDLISNEDLLCQNPTPIPKA